MKIVALIIAIVFSLIGVLGDSALKTAGAGPDFVKVKWFILGFTVYALTAFGWFIAMKYIKLGTLGVVYAIATLLFSVAIGSLWFKESYNSYEILAVLLAIISVFYLWQNTLNVFIYAH